MDEIEQAHQELDRIQGIIARHEEHMFALRGWLLAVLGGLLAAHYTANIDLSTTELRIAMLLVAAIFLVLETRHVNLIEAVVERATTVEELIRKYRKDPHEVEWYDGPRVNEACRDGARRTWPKSGMTFLLNLWFYLAVVVVVVVTTVSLPAKRVAEAAINWKPSTAGSIVRLPTLSSLHPAPGSGNQTAIAPAVGKCVLECDARRSSRVVGVR